MGFRESSSRVRATRFFLGAPSARAFVTTLGTNWVFGSPTTTGADSVISGAAAVVSGVAAATSGVAAVVSGAAVATSGVAAATSGVAAARA